MVIKNKLIPIWLLNHNSLVSCTEYLSEYSIKYILIYIFLIDRFFDSYDVFFLNLEEVTNLKILLFIELFFILYI